jgi:hypothetical protein
MWFCLFSFHLMNVPRLWMSSSQVVIVADNVSRNHEPCPFLVGAWAYMGSKIERFDVSVYIDYFSILKTWKVWTSLNQTVVMKTNRVYVRVKQNSSSLSERVQVTLQLKRASCSVQGDQKLSCCIPYLAGRVVASWPHRLKTLRTQLLAAVRSSSSLRSQTTSVPWERRGDWTDVGDAPPSHSLGMRRDTRQAYQTLESPLCWSRGWRTPSFNFGGFSFLCNYLHYRCNMIGNCLQPLHLIVYCAPVFRSLLHKVKFVQNELYGIEPFLRRWWSLSYSGISPPLMDWNMLL